MTQHGIVEQISGTQVYVRVAKTSMCGENCASCKGGCTPGEQTVLAVNETDEALQPGDVVLLETETGKVIANAALVYLLPLLCLFIAYFIAAAYTQSELVCALAALLSSLCAFLLIRIWDIYIKRKNTFLVRICQVLKKNNE